MMETKSLNALLADTLKEDRYLKQIKEVSARELADNYKDGERVYDLDFAHIRKLALRIYTRSAEVYYCEYLADESNSDITLIKYDIKGNKISSETINPKFRLIRNLIPEDTYLIRALDYGSFKSLLNENIGSF